MSKSVFLLSKLAKADLNNIWIYTFHKWSKEQADRYYAEILEELHFVANNPQTGKNFGHLRKDYKVHKANSHYIFYRNKKGKTVEIIRILNQRMNIEKHL